MKLAYKIAAGVAVAGVLLALLLWGRQPERPAMIGGSFALLDSGGHAVTDRAFRGRSMLVFFGYTTCPDVCPTVLANVAAALDTMGARGAAVQPVFISIDPARDTPAAVGAYVASFGPAWIGLTGSADQVAAAASAYRVYYARHRTGDGPLDYTMDHSSILYLVGPDGRFVAPLAADAPPDKLAHDLAEHIS